LFLDVGESERAIPQTQGELRLALLRSSMSLTRGTRFSSSLVSFLGVLGECRAGGYLIILQNVTNIFAISGLLFKPKHMKGIESNLNLHQILRICQEKLNERKPLKVSGDSLNYNRVKIA